jgi:hypothetical protein
MPKFAIPNANFGLNQTSATREVKSVLLIMPF